MTTTFDIDELERLLAAATPGEWEAITEVGVENFANSIYAPSGDWDGLPIARADQNGSTSNAALIVTLHNSAPAMIAELRELRAENARLREALDEDGLAEIITDTIDMDWQPRWAAQAIRRAALGEPQ